MIEGAPRRATSLADVLLDSLRQLAAAGETEAACQLAGQACALLRRDDPRNWGRFNGLLYRLARPDQSRAVDRTATHAARPIDIAGQRGRFIGPSAAETFAAATPLLEFEQQQRHLQTAG